MANELTIVDSYCTLNKTSLIFKRDVTKDEWLHVVQSLKMIEGCIQFWVGDCLAYREQKWGMYDDIAEETGYADRTLRLVKGVSEKIESGRRLPDLSFTHHAEVASLSPEKQNFFLNKAVEEKLSYRELRREIKKEKYNEQMKKVPLPTDKYRVIYADPPWDYGNSGLDEYGHAERHYNTMKLEEICNLPIPNLCEDNAVLFLWVTSPMLEDGLKVINAWLFRYKTSFVWDKIKHNFGYYNSVRHEFLLVATKGSCLPDVKELHDSVIEIERSEKHSEKPEYFQDLIDKLYITGRKIELFARNKTVKKNWDRWGDE